MTANTKRWLHPAMAGALMLTLSPAMAGSAPPPDDPHYTPSGFFDIHVCNWPDQDPFYLALYSTARFNEVESIDIMDPQGAEVGSLDLEKYKTIKREGKPEKRVFVAHIPVTETKLDGWYRAEIEFAEGAHDEASDFVIHQVLPMAAGHVPADRAEDVALPKTLRWDHIGEGIWYQVFIRDLWDNGKLIYSSGLLREPNVELPADLLEPGGYYSWKVHARDTDGHIQLGDFNLGSQSRWVEFTVSED